MLVLSCLTLVTEVKRSKNFTAHPQINCPKNLRSEYWRNHYSDTRLGFFFLDMIALLSTVFSILVIIQFVLGNFASGFIALVNCIAWVKRQKISSTDAIVTAMAVSRIVLLCVMLIHWYYILLHPALYSLKVRIIVHIAWIVSSHYSTWLATSLSIFYVLKRAISPA